MHLSQVKCLLQRLSPQLGASCCQTVHTWPKRATHQLDRSHPNHWTTEPLHPFWCTQQLTVFSLDRAVTSAHTLTHTHRDLCLCGPKDRLWRSIMAMIYSARIRFFLTRAYSCQWPNQMHSQCSTSMQMHSNNNNWVNGKHKIWLQQKAKNKRITRTRTRTERGKTMLWAESFEPFVLWLRQTAGYATTNDTIGISLCSLWNEKKNPT